MFVVSSYLASRPLFSESLHPSIAMRFAAHDETYTFLSLVNIYFSNSKFLSRSDSYFGFLLRSFMDACLALSPTPALAHSSGIPRVVILLNNSPNSLVGA